MIVENVSSDTTIICRIGLTLKETEAILHSLGRTMCKGEELTVSMELEDKLVDILKPYWSIKNNK